MITIINYGLGNISAFANVYKRLNIPVSIATRKEELVNARKIILPGVGAFDHAMTLLQQSGMRDMLDDLVVKKKDSGNWDMCRHANSCQIKRGRIFARPGVD